MLYPISFAQFHNMMHMQGTNLGDKIIAKARGATLLLDLEFQTVWVYYKGKLSGVPTPSIATYDLAEMPDHVRAELGLDGIEAVESSGPPYARKKAEYIPEAFDPNDEAAAHRARVRAASANANRPDMAQAQNDLMIQETRNAAMGIKTHMTAQVQNAQQVGESPTVTAKKKAISHSQLKAQIAHEAKTQL